MTDHLVAIDAVQESEASASHIRAVGDAPSGPGAVATRFRRWREKLLDLSLRNKLLNFRLDTKGVIRLDVPDVARFEDLLAGDAVFDVQARPDDQRGHGIGPSVASLQEGLVHSPLTVTAMTRSAIHVDRESRLAMEEGGANVLYAAIGLLKWFESESSSTERLAPLLLVPVRVEYIRSTRKVRLRRHTDESLPNFTLIEKAKADFGLDLQCLADVGADESGLDVEAMLRSVRQAIETKPAWEVLAEAHVGLFSFTKYLMWKDLGENADVLLENDVIRHIANKSKGDLPANSAAVPIDRLDDEVAPGQLPLVVDADSSQTAAVVSALGGRSFVLQGPPGTGKSQTITNLVAAAVASGKTVLFVSEKMAALDVVYRRLQSVGLGDFCLELHSHKSQKREVVTSLGKILERGLARRRDGWDDSSRELADLRTRLNDYVRAAGTRNSSLGLSFHEASARSMALRKYPAIPLVLPRISELTSDAIRQARADAAAFGEAAGRVGDVAAHLFRDVQVDAWSAQHDQEVRAALAEGVTQVVALRDARAALATALGIELPLSLSDLADVARVASVASAGPVPGVWRDEAAWRSARAAVRAWQDAHSDQARRRSELALRWRDDVLAAELVDLLPLFAKWSNAFALFAWLFLFSARRRLAALSNGTVPGNRQVAADLSLAEKTREAEDELRAHQRKVRDVFDGCGPIEHPSDVEPVVARAEALREVLQGYPDGGTPQMQRALALASTRSSGDERASVKRAADRAFAVVAASRDVDQRIRQALRLREGVWPADSAAYDADVGALLESWQQGMASFRFWCLYRAARTTLESRGLRAFADAHASGRLQSSDLEPTVEKALLEAWLIAARDASPVLRDFDGQSHDRLVTRFREVDGAHVTRARHRIASMLEERLPRTGSDTSSTSEPGILRREVAKKTRHMPLRKLLTQIPNLLTRLKPCLLMSPLSIAQYLPAGGRKFDLVVFDEASQICTHDAIGAIGRGSQVVVVGDSKQLPPTAFFKSGGDSDDAIVDEDDIEELESILDEALASGLPEQMLSWHYRSRHEALIEFSNRHYYDNRLNVFPAARGVVSDLGVKFHHVPGGTYDAGKTRTNAREAEALVQHIVARLRTTRPEERSFGVVTFSSAQKELVDDLLEQERKRRPEIEDHFKDDHPRLEPLLVKNLENVQGDERDEMYFSICYAADDAGRMLMNFGPLNREGGERRLNVAVTRARKQLRVFASIVATDIDTKRTKALGARHLKEFLQFAAERTSYTVTVADRDSGDFDSDFERDVFDELEHRGYKVATQVGCGSYRIDMAIVHPTLPGVYALGIECDGAAYHSGATARDRDRLRQQVLEGLGWRLHRIWSTDWIYNRAKEIERLVDGIEAAVAAGVAATVPPAPLGALDDAVMGLSASGGDGPQGSQDGAAFTAAAAKAEAPAIGRPYVRAEVPFLSADPDDIHQSARTTELRDVVQHVLEVEAPIHVDELTRRAAAAFSAQKAGVRIRRRVVDVIQLCSGFAVASEFVWPRGVVPSSDMSPRTGGDRDMAMVPLEEVAAAARGVLSRALSMGSEELVRDTARLFGIQRTGVKVVEQMRKALELLVDEKLCREDGGRVTWTGP